ncbi:hypothetical protein LTR16_004393 [Cryomyces antarcticus]|uniref:Microbial-type PARG catalytic domain-containing protein n=1 Tax=Cryomyces antarcticus TaxID=329879 RepID=A0ABR0M7Y3_9PEZI|nr:hypothetical protein LTR39_003744 [Cryomyces antarcticus]KAK5013673.1 hypothetical protein LTR60_003743 [Cryomyces antarcticus]KAK5285898.1 hypothetical protein LTR16_004393 [Cryomyces antarcticus]
MPQAKPKPSEVAAQAKKIYIPYIEKMMRECPIRSYLHQNAVPLTGSPQSPLKHRLRVAIVDGDPVDVALDWYEDSVNDATRPNPETRIPVVNMANERRAGGDWESGLMGPEECFARRSNLVHALITPWDRCGPSSLSHYPLPQKGGLYSPSVVVFRDGPDKYEIWTKFRPLPVITVAPVRRPKLDETGAQYSFAQERELTMDKMRTVLRIAAAWKHKDVCLGAFGSGPIFRNPPREIARMWRTLLFREEEFVGRFANVVFAIEKCAPIGPEKVGLSEYEIFKEEFDPSNTHPTSYR